MPSSSANSGEQSADNAAPLVSQKTQNLDKIPIIPPMDTPKKTKDTSTVINKYKVIITLIVGGNQDIKPRKKFVTLLSLIITFFPAITLEEWDSSEIECAQSITAGSDLPDERKHLEKYCPHDHHKSRLSTQWKN
eukprot:2677667-Ditylum_brightwellii.AAC.1